MGLIVVNAKVKLMSEEDFEDLAGHERRGTEPKSSRWVWRSIGIHTDDIKKIIQYNSTKSMIEGYYDDFIMVKEPFIDVYKKWDANKEENIEFVPDFGTDDKEQEGDEEA